MPLHCLCNQLLQIFSTPLFKEPVRIINGIENYYQAKARSVDWDARVLTCEDIFKPDHMVSVPYDYLVIAAGAKTNTFNTPGVSEREGKEVHFLKHLHHARNLRNRVLECFERASMQEDSQKKRLLSFVIVGGGPTSCEFAGELHDFIQNDISKWYPDLVKHISITIVERNARLLGSFDGTLSNYVRRKFKANKIHVRTGQAVVEVFDKPLDGGKVTSARLSDGSELDFGMMVWSAGLQNVKFIENLSGIGKGPTGRLYVDKFCRVRGQNKRVFAIGDCAVRHDVPLAPLAAVAMRQGQYLAEQFNASKATLDQDAERNDEFGIEKMDPFRYTHLFSMASLGGWKAVVDMSHVEIPVDESGKKVQPIALPNITGISAFIIWRSAYWTLNVSITNKILIPMYWFKAWIFGRDISRF